MDVHVVGVKVCFQKASPCSKMRYYVIEHRFELEASVQYGSEGLGGRAIAYLSMILALE